MGSCCTKTPEKIHEPEPLSKTSSHNSKTLKRFPTSIKIIPASPSQSSLFESKSPEASSPSANHPPPSLKSPESKPRPRNLLDLLKFPVNSSEKDQNEGEKNLLKRCGQSLKQPADSSLLSDSGIELIEKIGLDLAPKQIRRVSHSYFRQVSSFGQENRKGIVKKLVKSKSSDGRKKVNQYVFVKLLGRGAFGKVFEVFDEFGKSAAVKVFNKRILRNRWIGKKRTAFDSIKNEIDIMKKVKHPNAVKLVEVIDDETSAKLYLVMELATGGSLYEKSPMSPSKAKSYFHQFIQVLDYLHNVLSIVHRDLKPQNLLISECETLKICDFGAAQFIFDMNDELTNSAGTFVFMPPEAHKSGGYRGKPADIWAAGLTLYFILTGEVPFVNKSFAALMEEINSKDVNLPDSFESDLRDLMQKMTSKDPFKRLDVKEVLSHRWLTGCNSESDCNEDFLLELSEVQNGYNKYVQDDDCRCREVSLCVSACVIESDNEQL